MRFPVAPTTPNSSNSSSSVPFPLFLKSSFFRHPKLSSSSLLVLLILVLLLPYILDPDTTYSACSNRTTNLLPTNFVFAFPSFILPINNARLLPAGRSPRSCLFGFRERLVPF